MILRLMLCLIGGVLLSGCSGGGGGGGGGGGRDVGQATGFSIQLQPSSISLSYREGIATLPSTDLIATWQGMPPNPLYVFAIVEGNGIAEPMLSIDTVQARARVTAARLPAGDYTGRIVIRACPDSNCSSTVGGTPINVPYTVRVMQPAVTLEGVGTVSSINLTHRLGQVSPTRTLNVASGAGAWTAATSASWITLSQTSGSGGAALVLGVRPEELTTERLMGTVTVSTSNLGTQTINVSMLMTVPTMQTSVQSVQWSRIAGARLVDTQQVDVSLADGAVLPMTVSSNQPWIRFTSVASAASGSFVLALDPSAMSLPSGVHNATVTIHLEGGVTDLERNIQVQLTLARATLTTTAPIILGGDTGKDFSAVPLSFSLNTGSNVYPWTVASVPTWLQISRTSGAVGQAGDTVTLRPIHAQSTPGLANSSLLLSTTVNGEIISRTIPVEFALDARRLIASEVGIAFTDLPGTNRDELTHTLKVRDNYNESIPWTATDDAAWLTVTPSGTGGGDLVLSANTAGLPSDSLHTARVRISTTESTIDNDEYVYVGLWVGTSMPTAIQTLGGPYRDVVGDPIRPYLYAHRQDEAQIRVLNPYTGAQVMTITGMPTEIFDLTVSKDGQTLYVLGRELMIPVNLATLAIGSTISLPTRPLQLTYIRPNGVGLLLDSGAARLASDAAVSVGAGTYEASFAVSGDDRWAFVRERRYAIDFSQARGNRFRMTQAGQIEPMEDGSTAIVAANFDGSRVFAGRSERAGDTHLVVFNGLTLGSIVELAIPQTVWDVFVTRRGQAIYSHLDDFTPDLTVYNEDNSVALSGVQLGTLGEDLSATGDGNFALIAEFNSLKIVPIPR